MINGRQSTENRLAQVSRMLRTLIRCNHLMIHAADEFDLAHSFCSTMVQEGGYEMAWVGYAIRDEQRSILPFAYAGVEEGYLSNLNLTWADTERGQGAAARCIRSAMPQVTPDLQHDPRNAYWREEAGKRGYASSVCLPLKNQTGTFGCLAAYSAALDAFGAEDVELLIGAADDLAYGITQISERKRAEDELRRSEARYRAVVENQTEFIVRWKPDGTRTYANEAYRRYFGLTQEEAASASFMPLVAEEDRPAVQAKLSRLASGEVEAETDVHRVIKANGSIGWQEWIDQAVHDETGKILEFQSVGRDITERKMAEEAIRKSERVLREAEALGHTGSWEQNLGTGELFNTEENLRLFFGDDHGKGADLENYTEVVHPDDREFVVRRRAELLDEEGPGDIEYRVVWPDGSVHVIFGRATVVYNELGKAIRVYGTNVDITERKQAEVEIQRQMARAETLTRIAARLNRQLDLDAVVGAVCQEIVDTFKVSQATMSLYDEQSDLLVYAGGINIPPDYAAGMEPIARPQFDEFVRQLGPIMVVPDIQSVPGAPNTAFSSHLDVRTVVTAAMFRDEELIGVVALGVNGHVREFTQDELTLLKAISDQAAQAIANAQLLKAAGEQREQLRALSAKLVETQEAERRAIARQLHDEIGQTLSGLMMQLGTAKSLLPESATEVETTLEQSETLVQEVLGRTRAITAGLRPQVLDDLGLAPALRRVGEELQEATGITVKMRTAHLPRRLPAHMEVALFRIVQEALTNVRKHAQAHHAGISLEKVDGHVTLLVQDDGRGFEKRTARPRANGDVILERGRLIQAGHFGLIGMQERVAQLGGTLQITTAPGRGTTLRVELPLSATKAAWHAGL